MVFRSELQADRLHTFTSRAELWKLPPDVTVESAIQALKDEELVEYIEPDCNVRLAATIPADAVQTSCNPGACPPHVCGGECS